MVFYMTYSSDIIILYTGDNGMKYKVLIINFLSLLVGLLMVEAVFHVIAFNNGGVQTLVSIFVYNCTIALFLGYLFSLMPRRIAKWLIMGIVLLFGVYGFVELEFKNFLDNYYSFAAVSDGAGRVSEYVLYFIQDAKIEYYLCFVPAVILFIFNLVYRYDARLSFKPLPAIVCLVFVVLYSIANYGLTTIDETISKTYRRFNNTELLLNKIGLNHFLGRDLFVLGFGADNTVEINIIENEDEKPLETEDIYAREIDDAKWQQARDEEDNADIRTIDNYLMNREIDKKNDHTGEFADKNFIYFLVESLDYMAIDPDLTPNLYKIMNEGYHFNNHYTPRYSCTTGESEFIAMTSLVPYLDVCTPNYVYDNTYTEALSMLFKNDGYDTYSFHNWYDEFYERDAEHKSWGIDEYYDVGDLDIRLINGWQSDLTLIQKAYPIFTQSERFFSFVITSSMHFPYDKYSYLGEVYFDEINKYHPEYPTEIKRYLSKSIEFDRSIGWLLTELEKDGKLEDTVICIFSDHHPFHLSYDSIISHSDSSYSDRSGLYGNDKTPFIIYHAGSEAQTIENVCSTFDQVPTIANLFDLNYDPRLYFGKDIFLNESLVIYPNSDWICKEGVYSISKDTFYSFKDDGLSDREIANRRAEVENAYSISYAIMDHDYFSKRTFLGNPELKNTDKNEQ